MLPLKTTAYLGLFCSALLGAILYHPVVGMFAYLASYNINPLSHWWGDFLPDWATRYSFWLAIATTIGTVLHWTKLKFVTFLERQEILLIAFVAVLWLSVVVGQGYEVDYNIYKMTKVSFMLLLVS